MDFDDLSQRFTLWWAKQSFKPQMRSDLYKMLAAMLGNGMSLKASLDKIRRLWGPRKHPLVPLLALWSQGLSEGRKFSEVLAGFIPSEELTLIAGGERSNSVAEGMLQAQKATAAKMAMRAAIVGSLLEPSLLVVGAFGLLVGFGVFMGPLLLSMFPIDKFPGYVQTLLHLGTFMQNYWWLLGGVIVVASTAVMWSLGNWTGSMRDRVDRLPPWSMYQTYQSATFMIGLSALLSSGVPIPEAIRNIRAQSSTWMKRHLSVSLARLKNGDSYQEVFGTGMLDIPTNDLVAVYADLAEFDQAIRSIGESSIENSVTGIQRKSAVAKKLSLIIVGVLMGWIYSAFMSVQQVSGELTKQQSNVSQSAQSAKGPR